MSLMPSKDPNPMHSSGGLHKRDKTEESIDGETTRLLSRQTSDATNLSSVHFQGGPFSRQTTSSDTSSLHKRPYLRYDSGISSKYTGSVQSRGGLRKDDGSTQSKPATILVSRHGTSMSTKVAHHVGGLQKEESTHSDPSIMLVSLPRAGSKAIDPDQQMALLVFRLFNFKHLDHQHPKTIPELAPEKRGKRHRNPGLYTINQFRHWWKTSRLLVRLAGSYVLCRDLVHWTMMRSYDVTTKRGAKAALKEVKLIGRGGGNRLFLQNAHPFTRTLRIFIAMARAWEARVDNRFYEVGIAEGMAFLGNRCFRYDARNVSDWITAHIALPFSGRFIAPYLYQQSRPVIVFMGIFRAILPFACSYLGSAFGRQLTFAAYRAANYRWRPVQGIFHFHEDRGVYQDLDGDEALLALAREISVALGHDENAVHNRCMLKNLGFHIIGVGSGGHSYYRRPCDDKNKFLTLHVTPYGPSILNEMPRYIILARRFRPYHAMNIWDEPEANFFDASIPPEAEVQGFIYSGAYFSCQEWAALKNRFYLELASYNNACKIMGTPRAHIDSTQLQHNEIAFPPTDLITLKAFIRTGHTGKTRRKEKKRWKQVQAAVQKIIDAVHKYKAKGIAPNGVILYMDGLDCSGKSSTGGLICMALERSGYSVSMVQHNRPPTEEEKKRPWMDRFATPIDEKDTANGTYAALVWDRGPAGDFVYGNLNRLCLQDKLARYEEFRAFDLECDQRGILFCKLLFVTDRDSIAETLGKRLAHKHIAEDLQTWLDANSSPHFREGLEEIRAHIDPTDFAAFNKYKENLANFCEFARNTDNVGHVGMQKSMSIGYSNPWIVVCTSKRHPARLGLMKAFRHQLFNFTVTPPVRSELVDTTSVFFGVDKEDEPVLRPAPKEIVEAREHGISIKACLFSMLLGLLVYQYAYQTWNFVLADIT